MRSHRALGLFVSFLVPACTHPATHPPPGATAGDPGPRVEAIADAIVADAFTHAPEYVARLRPKRARYDALPDESLKELAARQAREDAWLAELRNTDRAKLPKRAALAYDIAEDTLSARKGARICRHELWHIGQMYGFHVGFANLAQVQPVGTEAARKDALARFRQMPAYVDTQIANLREGMRLGYTQAAVNVQQVVDQLEKLAGGDVETSAYFSPAERDGDAAFRAAWRGLLERDVLRALLRYRSFLRDEYLPRARTAYGVSANPDGAACYKALLRQFSTLPVDATQVHERGVDELAKITAEMRALATRSFGTSDVRAVLDRLTTEPGYLHASRDSVMTQAQAAIGRARAALPRAFHLVPESDVTLEAIPAYQEKTSAAHYLAAALDGSRPATYRVRLYQAEKQSTSLGESTAFHETIPGHHLQINIANQRKDNPDIARFLINSGFAEGWALYAERLADELGLYGSDVARMGMLSNAAWRAVRLIVDTGIHAQGWDRLRAIDTLMASTAMTKEQAAQEIDRYISWPGQATAYVLGYLEIVALRGEAEKALGARFALPAFHDRVLENGTVPLGVLRRNVEGWISGSRGM